MTNLLWYICLTSISVIIGVYAIYAKRHDYKISTLVVFYIFTTSITWIGEFTVLGIFNSYAYKPGISIDPWAENLSGHLFLNASMFPAAAILMATNNLGYRGATLIISAFILAEYLFTYLGIYEHHWWRYYMSVINTAAFLLISKTWFSKLKHADYRFSRAVTFYFVALPIIHTPMPFLLLWGKQYYSMRLINNLVGNMSRSSIIFIFSYHLIEIALLVFFVCILDRWYWKLVPFVIGIVGQSVLAEMGILIFQEGWKLIYTILIYIVCISVFILVEKYTLKPDQSHRDK